MREKSWQTKLYVRIIARATHIPGKYYHNDNNERTITLGVCTWYVVHPLKWNESVTQQGKKKVGTKRVPNALC